MMRTLLIALALTASFGVTASAQRVSALQPLREEWDIPSQQSVGWAHHMQAAILSTLCDDQKLVRKTTLLKKSPYGNGQYLIWVKIGPYLNVITTLLRRGNISNAVIRLGYST